MGQWRFDGFGARWRRGREIPGLPRGQAGDTPGFFVRIVWYIQVSAFLWSSGARCDLMWVRGRKEEHESKASDDETRAFKQGELGGANMRSAGRNPEQDQDSFFQCDWYGGVLAESVGQSLQDLSFGAVCHFARKKRRKAIMEHRETVSLSLPPMSRGELLGWDVVPFWKGGFTCVRFVDDTKGGFEEWCGKSWGTWDEANQWRNAQ